MQELRARISISITEAMKNVAALKKGLQQGFVGLQAETSKHRTALDQMRDKYKMLSADATRALQSLQTTAKNIGKPYQDATNKVNELKMALGKLTMMRPGDRGSAKWKDRPFDDWMGAVSKYSQNIQAARDKLATALRQQRQARRIVSGRSDEISSEKQVFAERKDLAQQAQREMGAAMRLYTVAARGEKRVGVAGDDPETRLAAIVKGRQNLVRELRRQMREGLISREQAEQHFAPWKAEEKAIRDVIQARKDLSAVAKNEAVRSSQKLAATSKENDIAKRNFAVAQLIGRYELGLAARMDRQAYRKDSARQRLMDISQRREELVSANKFFAQSMEAVRLGKASLWQPQKLNWWQKLKSSDGMDNLSNIVSGYLVGGRMGGIGAGIGRLVGGGMGGLVGAAIGTMIDKLIAGLQRFIAFMKNGLMELFSTFQSLRNMRAQTGLSYGMSNLISRTSEAAGIDPNALGLWFGRLQANIGMPKKPNPEVSIGLSRLGLTFNDLRRMSPDKMFMTIFEKLGAVKNQAMQSAISLALFNRQGVELQRIINNPNLIKLLVTQMSSLLQVGERTSNRIAYMGDTMKGFSIKSQQFFVGVFESLETPLMKLAAIINTTDLKRLGELVGSALEPVINGLVVLARVAKLFLDELDRHPTFLAATRAIVGGGAKALVTQNNPLAQLMLWAAGKIVSGISEREDLVPSPKNPGQEGFGIVPDLRLMQMGEGTQWSRIGLFSSPGAANENNLWARMADDLRDINRNTMPRLNSRTMAGFMATPDSMKSFMMSPAQLLPAGNTDALLKAIVNNTKDGANVEVKVGANLPDWATRSPWSH